VLCVSHYVSCTMRNVSISYVFSTCCCVLYVRCCVLRVVHVEKCVCFMCFNDMSGNARGSLEFIEMGNFDFPSVL